MEPRKSNPFRFSRSIMHVLTLAALFALGLTAHGTVIYSETFLTTNPTAPAGNKAFADYGWSAHQNDGTNRSSSSGDPVKVQTGTSLDGYGILGNGAVYDSFALVSAAGSIDPAAYAGDLQINLVQSASLGGSGTGMGWRFLVQVGSTIYASDFYSYTTGTTTISATLADSIWHVWTGEADLSNGFNKSGIAAAAGNLPAGVISNIGVLAIDATVTATDRLNLRDFEVTGTATLGSPVVIFKLDDLTASSASITGFSVPWDRLFDYSATKPLVISVGIIGYSLETTNPAYTTSIRQIHDAGRVEFWNHGYLHIRDDPPGTYEFKGTTYAYQLSNFQTTQTLARERLGFPFTTFGSPFNANDAVTRQVLETDPDMQTSFFGTTAFGPTDSRFLNLDLPLFNIEVSTGNLLDYNTLVTNYSAKRNLPYLVLQGHPSGWDEAEFETFKSFVDYLIADGATFMTPSGYRASMDTDNDGVPDVIERVLGRNPAFAEFTPPVSLDLSESRVVFEVAASQPARPRLALESSNNMGTWERTQISAVFITTLSDGRRRVEVPVLPGAERTFWRLSESSHGVSTWP